MNVLPFKHYLQPAVATIPQCHKQGSPKGKYRDGLVGHCRCTPDLQSIRIAQSSCINGKHVEEETGSIQGLVSVTRP
uniref:Uncharacterized protein n=1 Tax=Anguilla anguilla TaxID=7936 RepID=A0A0E9TLB7_ANGAN